MTPYYNHMFSPAIVTPGDYKVNWQVCANNASGSESYTLMVGTESFDDTVESTTWQSREFLFSVAEGDTVRLDFGHTTHTNSVGFYRQCRHRANARRLYHHCIG